jgi:Flp pilus assembly protein TadG
MLGVLDAPTPGDERIVADDGMSTVEAVFTVPVMVTMVLAIVQAALWWYAHQLAATAADEAARTARAYASTAAAGQLRGTNYLGTVDPDSSTLRTRQVTVTRNATKVTVRVTGEVVSIVPFLSPHVDVTVTAPVERYVASG